MRRRCAVLLRQLTAAAGPPGQLPHPAASCQHLRSASSNSSGAPEHCLGSAALIAKWTALLQQPGSPSAGTAPAIQTEQLRQLMQDAIHVFQTEGAAAQVPDAVCAVCIDAFGRLQEPQHKLAFLKLLVAEFGIQRQAVDAAVALWQQRASSTSAAAAPGEQQTSLSPQATSTSLAPPEAALMFRLADKLTAAAQPLYMQLLLPIAQHKAGIAFLVGLRADLLHLLKALPAAALEQQGAALRALDQHLRAALARWFSVGLLQLQRISWEHSPGLLLQRVLETEAVHRMQHLEQLRQRLAQGDRRAFAFMHPSLPGEPLVVLHTVLLDRVPDSTAAVLPQQHQQAQASQDAGSSSSDGSSHGAAAAAAAAADTASVACFYSISLGQPGLAGIDLGRFLIKRVAQLLLSELPHLSTLVTLSPIPGFRPWLITKLQQQQQQGSNELSLLRPEEEAGILAAAEWLASNSNSRQSSSSSGASSATAALMQLVTTNAWRQLPERQQQEVLRPLLLRLCARYLLRERRRRYAADPVANFHLRNGAQLWRLNWRADMSDQGLASSCGLMVNYRYELQQVAANNQAYLVDHHIAAAPGVRELLLQEPGS